MLTRIIFIVVLPVLMACEALKELGNPTGSEEEEIVEEVASAPEEEDPVEAIEEPAPEVAALSSEEALQALEDLGIPYIHRARSRGRSGGRPPVCMGGHGCRCAALCIQDRLGVHPRKANCS